MKEQLFNKFIHQGVNTKVAKNLINTLEKKGYIEKTNHIAKATREDINTILEYGGNSFAEYNLFLIFVKNQPINYKERRIQKMILRHKSLSEFALLDENCPQELKNKIPSHINPQKPPLSLKEAIEKTDEPLWTTKHFQENNSKEEDSNIQPIEIKKDADFLKKKEECFELIKNNFNYSFFNPIPLIKNIKKCLNVAMHTDDVYYKKTLYTSINRLQLTSEIAFAVCDNIYNETNPEILCHIFRECPHILEQQTGFMKDSSIICYISQKPSNHPKCCFRVNTAFFTKRLLPEQILLRCCGIFN